MKYSIHKDVLYFLLIKVHEAQSISLKETIFNHYCIITMWIVYSNEKSLLSCSNSIHSSTPASTNTKSILVGLRGGISETWIQQSNFVKVIQVKTILFIKPRISNHNASVGFNICTENDILCPYTLGLGCFCL